MSLQCVTDDGQKFDCSDTHHADLFHGLLGTFGTVGVVTQATIKLRVAPKYMKISYMVFDNIADAQAEMDHWVRQPNVHAVDGIMFSPTNVCINIGMECNLRGDNYYDIDGRTAGWYSNHVKHIAEQHTEYHEVVDFQKYLFHYDVGASGWASTPVSRRKIPIGKMEAFHPFLKPFFSTRSMYQGTDNLDRGYFFKKQFLSISLQKCWVRYAH